jgi:hypothetical protein
MIQAAGLLMLHDGFFVWLGLAYTSTLKMEATCFSETSIDFHHAIRRYAPKDGTLLF